MLIKSYKIVTIQMVVQRKGLIIIDQPRWQMNALK